MTVPELLTTCGSVLADGMPNPTRDATCSLAHAHAGAHRFFDADGGISWPQDDVDDADGAEAAMTAPDEVGRKRRRDRLWSIWQTSALQHS